ncbi:aminotransferase class V-fold PLP-dependent enzyme [Kineosporia sp. R_H_3]|uniref:pyridoxal phosphate-dependent decarboxylase family protein n=1 Tax=Kineosporia sp. R_H_3 TaxID=1961848 RepID=UPI000B4B8F1F|nr:aminotransferase class V-fold PLP-dependent enzyme [Kineosporia sp. R_H_3]
MTDVEGRGPSLDAQPVDLREPPVLVEAAALLEPGSTEVSALTAAVGAFAQHVLVTSRSAPTVWPSDPEVHATPAGVVLRDGPETPDATQDRTSQPPSSRELGVTESPRDISSTLDVLTRRVWQSGVNTRSPGYLGYLPAGGLYAAALGDFLGSVLNPYSAMESISPGAAELEQVVVQWLCEAVGLPVGSSGTLTSGGSSATLTAVVAARDWMGVQPQDAGACSVYVGEHRHHSVDRALRFAGLGGCPVRVVPSDGNHRMDSVALRRLLSVDATSGLRPWLVVATAGTTGSGSIDPLDDVVSAARDAGAWVHVDAAYGGLFALAPEARPRLRGLGDADSVTVDPHKTLFLPYGTGAILVRDPQVLTSTFSHDASYLPARPPLSHGCGADAQDGPGAVPSPADLGMELTRPFRALGLWLPLQLSGVQAFRDALSEKLNLARSFHAALAEHRLFRVGPIPDLTVATYRAAPAGIDGDSFNQELARRLQQSGQVYVTTTVLQGRVTLRAAIGSAYTHEDHLLRAVATIVATAERLADG